MKQDSIQALLTYMRPQRLLLILMLIFSILSVIFQVLIPIQIGLAINLIIGPNQVNLAGIGQAAGLLLALALSMALSQLIQEELTNRLTYNMTQRLRDDLFEKIHSVPLSYLDQQSFGDLVSRLINDVDSIGTGLLQSFTSLFNGVALIIGVIMMMLSLNVKIGLIVVILTPISVLVSTIIANRTYQYFQAQANIRGQLGGLADEMIHNQDIVRAFRYEERSFERFNEVNDELHQAGFWAQFYGAMINPTSRVINSIVYAVVGLVGAFTVLQGQLSVGILTSFLAYANQYSKPFNEISAVINEMQTALAASYRVFDFLQADDEQASRDQKELLNPKGNITIDHLSFSYDKRKSLIEDFSVQVKAGDTIAVVGPTGAGKTTLINLLMRFYDQDAGDIFIDGVNTLDMNRSNLRRQFGMVLQDSWIFAGSIKDNIAYGKPEASLEEIQIAAKKARLHPMIEAMPQAYDTFLEEDGANISTGQKQLISIARIMLMDPQILILDEATSSIDTLTEMVIQDSFDDMMQGRTAFIVAHRLSTIQKADLILYMENGQVKEQGSHERLLAAKGRYYDLYQSQFAGVE